MNWFIFVSGISIGGFLLFGLLSLYISFKSNDKVLHNSFFAFAILISASSIFALLVNLSSAVENVTISDKLNVTFLILSVIPFLFIISELTGYKNNKYIWLIGSFGVALVVANHLFPYGILWEKIVSIEYKTFISGDRVSVINAQISNRFFIVLLYTLFLFVYTIISLNHLWKRRQKTTALTIFIAFILSLGGALADPILIYFGYLGTALLDDFGIYLIGYLIIHQNFKNIVKDSLIKAELKKSENRLRVLAEGTSEAILITEGERIIDANEQFIKMFGFSLAEVRKLKIGEVIIPSSMKSTDRLRRSIITSENYIEFSARKKDKRIISIEVREKIISLKNDLFTVYAIRDLAEFRKLNSLMIQSEKMISLAGVAAGMAHEINNPLASISQGIQNISRRFSNSLEPNKIAAEKYSINLTNLEQYIAEREIDQVLFSMQKSTNNAAKIINKIIQFSRDSKHQFVLADIKKIIQYSISISKNDYRLKNIYDFSSINLNIKFDDDLPRIQLIPSEINQVIFNLLLNSVQAIRADKELKDHIIEITVSKGRDYVQIVNSDNGIGIKDSILKRIYEPFFTTKKVGEGSGLGLAVSYMIIVQNHKGIIHVESEEGEGTSVTVRLPLERNNEV